MLLTVAILEFEDFQETALLFAFLGLTVAFRVTVFCFELPFTFKLADFLLSLTLVTGCLTVTFTVAYLLLPSNAITLIVAVPLPFAVILPLWFTVATLALELVHFSFLFVALVGVTVALTVNDLPFSNVTEFLLNSTLVTFFTVGFVVVGCVVVEGVVLIVVEDSVVGSVVENVVGSVVEEVIGSVVEIVEVVVDVVGSVVTVVGSVVDSTSLADAIIEISPSTLGILILQISSVYGTMISLSPILTSTLSILYPS